MLKTLIADHYKTPHETLLLLKIMIGLNDFMYRRIVNNLCKDD